MDFNPDFEKWCHILDEHDLEEKLEIFKDIIKKMNNSDYFDLLELLYKSENRVSNDTIASISSFNERACDNKASFASELANQEELDAIYASEWEQQEARKAEELYEWQAGGGEQVQGDE